jgi:hypothetical protein
VNAHVVNEENGGNQTNTATQNASQGNNAATEQVSNQAEE